MKIRTAQNLYNISKSAFKLTLLGIILFISLCIFTFLYSNVSYAQTNDPVRSPETQVTASVGDFYLNLSGYITAFASIVLDSDKVFLRSTVSDENGDFIIPQVLIKKGFDNFCLDAIDFKRLGESYKCFTIPPATATITMDNIFLPPTLGLEKDSIPESGFTYAYGYTMPDAIVTLHFSNGRELATNADNTGYYRFVIKDLKAGEYTLFATAVYNHNQSLIPDKKVKLRSLSTAEEILEKLKKISQNLRNQVGNHSTSNPSGLLWVIIAIIILIIILILILKIWPEKFTFIYRSKIILFAEKSLGQQKHPLHHLWWIGY